MSSSKIPLYLRSIPSSDGITVTRVVANVGFLGNDGRYAIKDIAIIDTGAPVSLIPFEVWSWCPVELGEKRVIQSVSGREECDLEVYQGEITIALFDEENKMLLSDLTIEVDLCATSEMPTLLGVHDFLSRACLHVDYAQGEAWLKIWGSKESEFYTPFQGEAKHTRLSPLFA